MKIANIAGYKFITLNAVEEWRKIFLAQLVSLKGTVLLSHEGININLSGEDQQVENFKAFLQTQDEFCDIDFRCSYSSTLSFKRLKVKIKKEIITLRQRHLQPEKKPAPSISARELKQWLDAKHDFTLLDTRNHYETNVGAFEKAVKLDIEDFCQFPATVHQLDKQKPIVMYCTGGIRCEKASLFLLDAGFTQVYQLKGGILQYFADVGGAHYRGHCFVFDERAALDTNLQPVKIED